MRETLPAGDSVNVSALWIICTLVLTAPLVLSPAFVSELLLRRDDPALRTAVGEWFDGDGALSLTAIAGIALSDNTAAHILLDGIRAHELAATPRLIALPSAEQKAVFRRMDRRLATKWTRVAPETSLPASAVSVCAQPYGS